MWAESGKKDQKKKVFDFWIKNHDKTKGFSSLQRKKAIHIKCFENMDGKTITKHVVVEFVEENFWYKTVFTDHNKTTCF